VPAGGLGIRRPEIKPPVAVPSITIPTKPPTAPKVEPPKIPQGFQSSQILGGWTKRVANRTEASQLAQSLKKQGWQVSISGLGKQGIWVNIKSPVAPEDMVKPPTPPKAEVTATPSIKYAVPDTRPAYDKLIEDIKQSESPEIAEAVRLLHSKGIETFNAGTRGGLYHGKKQAYITMERPEISNQEKLYNNPDVVVDVGEAEGVKPLMLAKDEDIDIDKYIEFLKSVFLQILDSLDIEFDSIIGVTKLERFM